MGRNLEVVNTLLKYGADISIKAAPPPQAHKISIIRHDLKHQGGAAQETKKISFDHKTALLIALELKSSLYLKGMHTIKLTSGIMFNWSFNFICIS